MHDLAVLGPALATGQAQEGDAAAIERLTQDLAYAT